MINWQTLTPRERDALVAEKVMGWVWLKYPKEDEWAQIYLKEGRISYWMDGVCTINTTNKDETPNCPFYTTSIKTAWVIIDKMDSEGWVWDLNSHAGWRVRIAKYSSPDQAIYECSQKFVKTLTESICIAALRAKGLKINTETNKEN